LRRASSGSQPRPLVVVSLRQLGLMGERVLGRPPGIASYRDALVVAEEEEVVVHGAGPLLLGAEATV
jgi:hypothetical protein